MSDNQVYYYLRIKENFYEREEIRVIESLPNGYKYSNILLKMYLKSLKRNGKLMVTDYIPYSLQTLSAVLGHDIDTVKAAIDLFKQFKLLEVLDNGAIYLMDIQNFIGSSSTEADRKRAYRLKIEEEKRKLELGQKSDKSPTKRIEPCNKAKSKNEKDKCPDKTPPETEIETELELETELEIETTTTEDIYCGSSFEINFDNLKDFCEKYNFKKATTQNIKSIINDFKGWWIKEAIEIAMFNNNRNLGYVFGILRNWREEGRTEDRLKSKEFNNVTGKSNKVDSFNNFEQRKYDFDELEKDLLGWRFNDEGMKE
ncbi:phage replisome organizer N-terminal domain-containing protein [Clostridium ihumii]|uniref:phage replisome organizer N-terminal domain-containing protein n=1 Tax=Clostridium ihumii TaxID=1470356 RepID=UPI00054E325A|nr:phage replisome organizer N-terminal domain-containing protein [Clostridium ihumii]